MSVYRPSHTRLYLYDFQVDGRRFHGSTGKSNERDAEQVERDERAKALVEIAAAQGEDAQIKGRAPLTLDVAAGKWWIEVGQRRADHKDCWTAIERMIAHFGKDRRLDRITDADIAAWVATRRGERVKGKTRLKSGKPAPFVTEATVNRTTVDALRRIYGRARRKWKIVYATEPDWAEHRLAEPDEITRELEAHEQDALMAVAREGYDNLYRFARISGLRLAACLIPKTAVKWGLGRIEIVSKGRKLNRVPLSDEMIALLRACWNDHDTMVFTFVAARTRKSPDAAKRSYVRGRRYPITESGLDTQWKIDRRAAAALAPSIVTFRFHDNRHTAATRILRSSKNLKIVQRVLNHSRISTSAKYAHVLDEDVLDAMNATPDHQNRAPRKPGKVA